MLIVHWILFLPVLTLLPVTDNSTVHDNVQHTSTRMRGSCQRAKVSIIGLFHHSADPTNVVGQFGVYSELSAFSATFAKTRDAKYGPGAIRSPGILAQKGTSAVTRA